MRSSIEKPETQNQRLGPTGLAEPSKPTGMRSTGPSEARQHADGWIVGRFWNETQPFFRSEPIPLAGYPDQVLTLWQKN